MSNDQWAKAHYENDLKLHPKSVELVKQQAGEVQGDTQGLAEHITDHLCHHEYDIGGRKELLDCVTEALAARQMVNLSDDVIRDVFMRNGFTIKDGQDDLKPYVYSAARDLLATARKTVEQEPVGTIRDRDGVFEIELSESAHDTDAGALDGRSVYLSPAQAVDLWQPIETAPKNGSSMLLGHFNSTGKWRTVRGRWFSGEHIEMEWENADGFEAGWYEESVEADDTPDVWPTTPTHWQPLPVAPFYSKAVQS